MASLDMSDHRVHVDAVNGKRLSLSLNAPVIALSGNLIQRSLELTRWLKRQRLGVVLIAGDLAWGTAQRAVVVGAQVMGWPLIGGVVTLFWPLDDGVYTAVISDAEGEVSVVDGSEQVLPIDQALELAGRSADILLVEGGAVTERFRDGLIHRWRCRRRGGGLHPSSSRCHRRGLDRNHELFCLRNRRDAWDEVWPLSWQPSYSI